LLLATDKPVLAVPAMNVRMWQHAATVRNVARLRADGVTVIEPDEGDMACGEYGPGRLPEPAAIADAIRKHLADREEKAGSALAGKHVLVTAGPTHEPIDPVRLLANRSSGKQGFAIAEALAALGARVSLVAGPVALPTPPGVTRIDVETALQMQAAVRAALPADAAVMVAAVADWRVEPSASKLKKSAGGPPELRFIENPDLLAELASSLERPAAPDRLCRGDERRGGKCAGQAGAQGLRLDRRQRCFGRRDGRRCECGDTGHGRGGGKLGTRAQSGCGAALAEKIAAELGEHDAEKHD
jgi:phosphopantothenoylcysteine decarboxylase/phosphopantothenate--cysteine ligase